MPEVDDLRENERLKRELEETREDLQGLLPLERNAEHEKDIAAANEALYRLTGRLAYFQSLASKYEGRAEHLADALEQIVVASEKGSATDAVQEMLGIAESALDGTNEATGDKAKEARGMDAQQLTEALREVRDDIADNNEACGVVRRFARDLADKIEQTEIERKVGVLPEPAPPQVEHGSWRRTPWDVELRVVATVRSDQEVRRVLGAVAEVEDVQVVEQVSAPNTEEAEHVVTELDRVVKEERQKERQRVKDLEIKAERVDSLIERLEKRVAAAQRGHDRAVAEGGKADGYLAQVNMGTWILAHLRGEPWETGPVEHEREATVDTPEWDLDRDVYAMNIIRAVGAQFSSGRRDDGETYYVAQLESLRGPHAEADDPAEAIIQAYVSQLPGSVRTDDLSEAASTFLRTDGSDESYEARARHVWELLDGGEQETLMCLVRSGPVWDGDVPSKRARTRLIRLGLASKAVAKGEEGYQVATYAGFAVWKYGGLASEKE